MWYRNLARGPGSYPPHFCLGMMDLRGRPGLFCGRNVNLGIEGTVNVVVNDFALKKPEIPNAVHGSTRHWPSIVRGLSGSKPTTERALLSRPTHGRGHRRSLYGNLARDERVSLNARRNVHNQRIRLFQRV